MELRYEVNDTACNGTVYLSELIKNPNSALHDATFEVSVVSGICFMFLIFKTVIREGEGGIKVLRVNFHTHAFSLTSGGSYLLALQHPGYSLLNMFSLWSFCLQQQSKKENVA